MGEIFTKKARTITMVLSIASVIICCCGLNLMGGYAFIVNDYQKCGCALFISSGLLAASLILAILKMVVLPLILNITGSAFYIYTLAVLNAIPHTKIPKEYTEQLMVKHFPTIAVTVLLALLIFFNFMSDEGIEKRCKAKLAKKAAENRELKDNEKLI